MRRWRILAVAVSMIGGLLSSGSVSSAQAEPLHEREAKAALQVIAELEAGGDDLSLNDLSLHELGPPPWTSFVPNRDPAALKAWHMLIERFPEVRGQIAPFAGFELTPIQEAEPGNTLGQNDTPETGELVPGFGTGADDADFARIRGNLFVPPPPPDCESVEDDGSIPTANPTNLSGPGEVHLCSGVLGDGPHGDTTGDFDWYVFHDAAEGDFLIVDVQPDRDTMTEPETTIAIYDGDGNLLAEADDPASPAAFLEIMAPSAGDFYAVVGGIGSGLSDPFDSSSGSGATSTGPYEVFIVHFAAATPCPIEEDDGSIPLSNDVSEIVFNEQLAFCNGIFGDGPFGESSGDFDFYFIGELPAGATAIVDLLAPGPITGSTIALYDSTGAVIASIEDDGSGNDLIEIQVPATEFYFAAVGPGLPGDPFDSSSGSGQSASSEYTVVVGAFTEQGPGSGHWSTRLNRTEHEPEPPTDGPPMLDTDFFLLELEAGDTISAGFVSPFDAPIFVELYDPESELLIGSEFISGAFIYPLSSPLRNLGDVGVDHVAATSGTYALGIGGFGPYEGEVRIARPGLETATGSDVQIIYLDFDGDTIDPSIFDPFFPPGEQELSPLSDFLDNWGLEASDENAVIDAIIAKVNAELRDRIRMAGPYGDRDGTGVPGEFDVQITNSRDHGDMWGEANVSRVIVGGTILESLIPTVGIASSIDPGNLFARDQAIVLLDLLSSDPEETGDISLNAYDFAEPLTKVDVVGAGVGVIVAHEIGHFIGNWHTETGNESFQIMDAGGDAPGTFGVGPDLTFGTDDDIPVHFGTDIFNAFEGFYGTENTEARTGFAMATGQAADAAPPTGVSVDDIANHVNFTVQDAEVLRLYVAFFNRQPDLGGATYWVGVRQDGASLEDISGFFTGSQEFANNYDGTTDEQFLGAVYANVLGRDFDQSGFDYWLNLLTTGRLDRGGVVMWISLNQEFATDNPFGGK